MPISVRVSEYLPKYGVLVSIHPFQSLSRLHPYSFHLNPNLLPTGNRRIEIMGDQTIQPDPESPEIIAFATRMYDAARQGDVPIFEQALPAGLPPNLTNDKGDSLVRSSQGSLHLPLGTLACDSC